jgi:CRP/FNR family transcriptional regulator
LHSVTQETAVDPAPSPLQRALAQVEDLKSALALSRHETAALREEQGEIKKNADAQLRLSVHRGIARSAMRCSTSEPTGLSLSTGLGPDEMLQIERLLTKRIRFRRRHAIYRSGDGFDALYAICAGSCKTVLLARDGQEQVAGYHIGGEIIGIDGISSNVHECEATALEDMEVCRIPFERIENFARFSDQFRHNLYMLLSQESSRVQALTHILGSMRAEKRLAIFLLDLSHRYKARGFSSCEFVLRMTREEIGSYLGLKLETVSRLFSRFQNDGVLQVQGRLVKLLDQAVLSRLADSSVQ